MKGYHSFLNEAVAVCSVLECLLWRVLSFILQSVPFAAMYLFLPKFKEGAPKFMSFFCYASDISITCSCIFCHLTVAVHPSNCRYLCNSVDCIFPQPLQVSSLLFIHFFQICMMISIFWIADATEALKMVSGMDWEVSFHKLKKPSSRGL